MTPATHKRKGRRQMIGYHLESTPLGYMLIAATDKGLCSIRLGDATEELEAQFCAEFEDASRHEANNGLVGWVAAIVHYLQGLSPLPELPLDIQGTAFQARVWDALGKIAYGETVTYGQLAESILQPRAVRAVARACAANPVPLVIPCHRVVPKSGGTGGYGGGPQRKQKLLAMEARQRNKGTRRRSK
jgi:AraC family transcriptional regulator of adaptative response/methylated-DNA-[protein]-cysteine methyltransferase